MGPRVKVAGMDAHPRPCRRPPARAVPSTGDETLDRTLARREAWLGFAAAMFPDADVFVSPFSAEFYITQHRAFTHSFVTLPAWAVLLTMVASIRLSPGSAPRRGGRRTAVGRLGVVVALALASHILLDWITSWGTMFLSPISSDVSRSTGPSSSTRLCPACSSSASSGSTPSRGGRSRGRGSPRAPGCSRRPRTWASAASAMPRPYVSATPSRLSPRTAPRFHSRDRPTAGSFFRTMGPP